MNYHSALFCPDLPKLGNGSIECDRQFKRGSICKYSCNKGFELHPLDHEGHFCNKNAAWVGMPTPKCVGNAFACLLPHIDLNKLFSYF